MIEARGLVKRRGQLEVLRGVDLIVKRGEVAVVLGPSGGGKSTLLRCLNGLEKLDSGSVGVGDLRFDAAMCGRRLESALVAVRRRLGMVFQSFNLFPHLTALGNVTEAPRYALGKPREEAEEDARRMLDRVGLSDKLHARPGELSGGQQQRVAIARTLAMRPEAILFDEPTSALDPLMTAEVLAVMADLASEGQTMVVVTHALGFARRAAHTVHFIGGGRVIESSPPDRFFDDPVTDEVRGFLAKAKDA